MIPDWRTERWNMVEKQLRRRGIRDERVLGAMLEIPREEFIPLEARLMAYHDDPVFIGYGQTVSQPYMTALMAECLELTGSEVVLEIGSGSGYAAALLGALAARVISIEIIPALLNTACENLRRAGRDRNITVIQGDGSVGYERMAPFDAISVAAAAPELPATLLDQLKDPGRLVIPVGGLGDQELRVVRKHDGNVESRIAAYCRFVPLRGGEGWQ